MDKNQTEQQSVQTEQLQGAFDSCSLSPRTGQCAEIAAAAHDLTGDTIIAVVRDDEPEYALHLLCRRPDGELYDGSGARSEAALKNEYDGYDPETEQDCEARLVSVQRDAVPSLTDSWNKQHYEQAHSILKNTL